MYLLLIRYLPIEVLFLLLSPESLSKGIQKQRAMFDHQEYPKNLTKYELRKDILVFLHHNFPLRGNYADTYL